MENSPDYYGIIPARYHSSRFPGKPLAEILGKPMLQHVYERAMKSGVFQKVVLATDDERIRQKAASLDIPVLMTAADHSCGTERALDAARQLALEDNAVVVNIQGDEPALHPEMLVQLTGPFSRTATMVTTLARPLSAAQARSPDTVKVVCAADGKALYFSRAPIPYCRDNDADATYYGHIGLYAFRMGVLQQFVRLPPSRLEQVEKLEQLRLLENNIPLHVVFTQHRCHGVDRPEDIPVVERLLQQ